MYLSLNEVESMDRVCSHLLPLLGLVVNFLLDHIWAAADVQADRCHPWAYQLRLSDGALLRPADDKCNFWPAAPVVDVVER
jgi:hypothetical protein